MCALVSFRAMDLEIESLTVVKLKEELKKLGFTGGGRLKKAELVTTLRELRAKVKTIL